MAVAVLAIGIGIYFGSFGVYMFALLAALIGVPFLTYAVYFQISVAAYNSALKKGKSAKAAVFKIWSFHGTMLYRLHYDFPFNNGRKAAKSPYIFNKFEAEFMLKNGEADIKVTANGKSAVVPLASAVKRGLYESRPVHPVPSFSPKLRELSPYGIFVQQFFDDDTKYEPKNEEEEKLIDRIYDVIDDFDDIETAAQLEEFLDGLAIRELPESWVKMLLEEAERRIQEILKN